MSQETNPTGALALGRAFFEEVMKPLLEENCPEILEHGACGRFGYGSECLGLDDELSRDHHWGPRVDILLPKEIFERHAGELGQKLDGKLPSSFRGFELEAGHVGSAGLSPECLPDFLTRTLGRVDAPKTPAEWLELPEVDIVHVVNGEVWHDTRGDFTKLRQTFQDYYPDEVWKRRIAHTCRYASGMGLYAMHRAVMRDNQINAMSALGQTMRLTMELTFLLNRTYAPYEKWLYVSFCKLPNLASDIKPLLDKAVDAQTSWKERIALLEDAHELIDRFMVESKLIPAHEKFKKSESSGYRLLEYAYGALCRELPETILEHVPVSEQVYLEEFHTGYVKNIPAEDWHNALNLYS